MTISILTILTIGVPLVAILSQIIGQHSKLTTARTFITIGSVFYCLIGLTANGLCMEKYNEPFSELIDIDIFIMVCLIIVNQGYKWLKVIRPILCVLYCMCTLVAGALTLMEGTFGGEEVFNKEFTKCNQQEKNKYFDHQHFSDIFGIDPPKEYNVSAYEIHLYGPDSSSEYELTFLQSLTPKEKASFIDALQTNGWEQNQNNMYIKHTAQEEVCVEIKNDKITVQHSSF